MKYLIVGRSCVGKSTLAQKLEIAGLKTVKSYTTRPKRDDKDNDHIFITPEDAKSFTDRVASTTINGYDYFTTREQVKNSDIYVIDPIGVYKICEHMPDTEFALIYITAKPETSRTFALNRTENTTDNENKDTVYDARRKDEDAEFTDFEQKLADNKNLPDNIAMTYQFENQFTQECITGYAAAILNQHAKHKHMEQLIKEMIDAGRMRIDNDGNILCKIEDDDGNPVDSKVDVEHFATLILGSDSNFHVFMNEWLELYKI